MDQPSETMWCIVSSSTCSCSPSRSSVARSSGPRARSKGRRASSAAQAPRLGLALGLRQRRQVDRPAASADGAGAMTWTGSPSTAAKRGAQGLVAAHDLAEAALQGGDVERPAQAHGGGML